MVELSNAKVNIGLNVTSRRTDGFHQLESIFIPIPIYDEIEIKESLELTFTSEGIEIPGSKKSNFCLKAFDLIRSKRNIPNVHIHLKKKIPIGAGLGGGSSNGAFVLKMLNEIFSLHFTIDELEEMALMLGSDCAFFIQNQPCYVTGRGEKLDFSLDFSFEGYMYLINPGIHIGTKEAYSSITPMASIFELKKISLLDINEWTGNIINDFEKPMVAKYDELLLLKNKLEASNAAYVSMSGSGSSFFALYISEPPKLDLPPNYYSKVFKLVI